MTVLVVDDDRDQLAVREKLLRNCGFDVVKAAGREEARRLAADHRPGCVVMDLNLPATDDGLALIRDLKEIDPKIHLIILTGLNRRVLERRLDATTVDHVLRKPAASAQLIRTLKAYA